MSGRVLVLGGGLAGMWAALCAARAGARVAMVAGGQGAHHLFSGCVDVLAYPPGDDVVAPDPLAAVARLAITHPTHPYAKVGVTATEQALHEFTHDMAEGGVPYVGNGRHAQVAVTALGTFRHTALVPHTMTVIPERIDAVCNLNSFHNFAAELLADELSRRLDRPVRPLHFRHEARRHDAIGISRQWRDPGFKARFAAFLAAHVPGKTVVIPALLGLDDAAAVKAEVEARFGGVLVEAAGQPPSLPGLRMFGRLRRLLLDAGVVLMQGARAVAPMTDGSRVRGVQLQIGTTLREEVADAVVLATGHLVSGGLVADRERLFEPVFGVPVGGSTQPPYFHESFLSSPGHPVLSAGVEVDERLRPGTADRPVYANLFACGDILAGFDPYRERSGGGVALATGGRAGRLAAAEAA